MPLIIMKVMGNDRGPRVPANAPEDLLAAADIKRVPKDPSDVLGLNGGVSKLRRSEPALGKAKCIVHGGGIPLVVGSCSKHSCVSGIVIIEVSLYELKDELKMHRLVHQMEDVPDGR